MKLSEIYSNIQYEISKWTPKIIYENPFNNIRIAKHTETAANLYEMKKKSQTQ